jgi:thiamine biosynthesis lipoprotein
MADLKRRRLLHRFFQILLVTACILLPVCTKQNDPQGTTPNTVLFTQNRMTIDYHVTIGAPLTPLQKEEVRQIIDGTFNEIDFIYNKWNPLSEVSQLNQLNALETRPLSTGLHQFFRRVDELVSLSGGRFDPTLEPLQKLWAESLEKGERPNESQINELKSCLGWDKISFLNGIFHKTDARTRLDFGGIAKGLAVDLLVERLNKAGFSDVFIEWGGEVRASGQHPDDRPWNLLINRPGDTEWVNPVDCVALNDLSIATSGDYFQQWTIQGLDGEPVTYYHVFNIRTLSPQIAKKNSVVSASFMTTDCVTADALAKVLMLFDSDNERLEWLESIQDEVPSLSCWILKRS